MDGGGGRKWIPDVEADIQRVRSWKSKKTHSPSFRSDRVILDMLPVRIVERERLLPSEQSKGPTSVPLSILDATITRFTPTSCIWLYQGGNTKGGFDEALIPKLKLSLQQTLNGFPHIAGQLRLAQNVSSDIHTERWGRPWISYGTSSDPGIAWVEARVDSGISLIRPHDVQSSQTFHHDATQFPEAELLSNPTLALPFALHDTEKIEGLPNMSVQVSRFACGGYAIGVRTVHCLADSQSLLVFMHAWAANNKAGRQGPSSSLRIPPIFDPLLLDAHAAGNSDTASPDHDILDEARNLPLHRYDGWSVSPLMKNNPARKLFSNTTLSPSTPPPWDTWDRSKPVSHAHLFFANSDLDSIRASTVDSQHGHPTVSRMDCLVAHLWAFVNRARRLTTSQERVYLDVTLGARSRVDTPLADGFLGSPLFISHVSAAGADVCIRPVCETALSIRRMLDQFTPSAIGALLHDAAFEVSPQRLLQSFLGERHLVVSAWTRLDLWGLDFQGRGADAKPVYVHPVMPNLDGFIEVHESREGRGLEVSLHLESGAMGRLLKDETLDLRDGNVHRSM